jgi:GNAT superfamily N-acetyltransferase
MASISATTALHIVEYHPRLAAHFYAINAEWIEAMFALEAHDKAVLSDPDGQIIAKGGAILFAATDDMGIVGTCALMPSSKGAFELTKMGVLASARGRKAGEFLLDAAIVRARQLQARRLYLLTNHICEAAIHLYEKAGFRHDAAIMAEFGSTYARCDVAMAFPL